MSYALLNIEAIKKQALRKPVEALENNDRANTLTLEDISTLKIRYNKLLNRVRKAEEYLENNSIPLATRELWVPQYKELPFKLEENLARIDNPTTEEILEGFKL